MEEFKGGPGIRHIWLMLLTAFAFPFVVASIYFFLWYAIPFGRSGVLDALVFGPALVSGLCTILRLPLSLFYRLCLGVFYVPFMALVLFIYWTFVLERIASRLYPAQF